MKQILTVFAVLVVGIQAAGQNLDQKVETFRVEVLSSYNSYFSSVELTNGNQLKLSAQVSYTKMSRAGKKAIMDNLVKNWQESLLVVQYGTLKELWGWDGNSRESILIDYWDSDPKPVAVKSSESLSNSELHPWFLYIGGAQRMDSEKNINGALSARVGFFLLKDAWDLAATFSELLSGNIENDEISLQTSIGIMSKVYYPIKKYSISPFIGGEAAIQLVKDGDPSFTFSPLLGLSWYVGLGSLDLGVRVTGGKPSMMVGFTLVPKFR